MIVITFQITGTSIIYKALLPPIYVDWDPLIQYSSVLYIISNISTIYVYIVYTCSASVQELIMERLQQKLKNNDLDIKRNTCHIE